MKGKQRGSVAELAVRNTDGIDCTDVLFESGVTVLAGRNTTNRTSLLHAVIAVCGSDDSSMKAEAEQTKVRIESSSDRCDALCDEGEAAEAKISPLEGGAYDEVLDLHKEANRLEYLLGLTETDSNESKRTLCLSRIASVTKPS